MLGSNALGIFFILEGTPTYGMIKYILFMNSKWLNNVLKINIYKNGKVLSSNHPKANYNIFQTEFGSEKRFECIASKI